MSELLLNHLNKYINIPNENRDAILAYFTPKAFKKKEMLLQVSQKCKHHYFVEKGCLRLFFINNKGVEQTIQFAIENWWITDYVAFENQLITEFSIQAIENTEVLEIEYNAQEKLLNQFPELERYFRLVLQRAYSASLIRIKYIFDFDREEFYLHFSSNFPEFTNRIPQHILASYLNMTPEYLSEIKKKLKS